MLGYLFVIADAFSAAELFNTILYLNQVIVSWGSTVATVLTVAHVEVSGGPEACKAFIAAQLVYGTQMSDFMLNL